MQKRRLNTGEFTHTKCCEARGGSNEALGGVTYLCLCMDVPLDVGELFRVGAAQDSGGGVVLPVSGKDRSQGCPRMAPRGRVCGVWLLTATGCDGLQQPKVWWKEADNGGLLDGFTSGRQWAVVWAFSGLG